MANNELRKFLEDKNFKQVVNKATHIEGGHLNHVYIMNIRDFVETPYIEIIPFIMLILQFIKVKMIYWADTILFHKFTF